MIWENYVVRNSFQLNANALAPLFRRSLKIIEPALEMHVLKMKHTKKNILKS